MSAIEEFLRTDVTAPFRRLTTVRPTAEAGTERRHVPLRRLLVSLDVLGAATVWALTLLSSAGFTVGVTYSRPVVTLVAILVLTSTVVAAVATQRLYQARVCAIRSVETLGLGRAAAASFVAALLLPRALPISIDTTTAGIGAGASLLALAVLRSLYRHWLTVSRSEGRFLRSVVLVGSNEEAADLHRLLGDHPELGYEVAGVVGDRSEMVLHDIRAAHLGTLDDPRHAIAASGANGVIVAASAVPSPQLNVLTRQLLEDGVHVHLSSGLRGIAHRRLRAQPLAHEPLFYLEPRRLASWQLAVKRAIDLLGSVVGGILVAAPLVALAAVAIKLQDGGSVFFRQERIGRNGRPFSILKLRTMVPNADRLYAGLAPTMAGRDGPLIKLANDPRRTKVGRLLERFSIDELPQLLNVVRGEMSLVGPRPAQASEVAAFDRELLTRLSVPPGVTGLWQVEARDNPSFAAYRRYDLYYLENWSVGLDLAILVGTVQQVVLRGAALLLRRKPELAPVRPHLVTD